MSAPETIVGGGVEVSRDPVAQRILAVLEACADTRRPVTITHLVNETGLAKSTIHRMCWKLADLGLLDHEDGGFSIGTRMVALGSANPVVKKLRAVAIPHLMDLQRATGASQLGVLTGNKVLILDGLYTKQLRAHTLVGVGMPLHCTALGKAILSILDPAHRDQLLGDGPLRAATRWTITDPVQIRRHLDQIAEAGYALSDEEFQTGISAAGVAFKIAEKTYAAIGCVGNATDSSVHRSAPQVVEAAEQLLEIFVKQ